MADSTISDSLSFYRLRYAKKGHTSNAELRNPYAKIVEHNGTGAASLAGTKNFRAVLPGIVYRGGAAGGTRPLSKTALSNLCQEGFGTAIYLYANGYNRSMESATCKVRSKVLTVTNTKNNLKYYNKLVFDKKTGSPDMASILQIVYERITSKDDHKPIYLHCWNGWHASGYASAIVLRQFCGLSGRDAVEYWKCNADLWSSGYPNTKKRILNFKPVGKFKISSQLQREICPVLSQVSCPALKR